jgi:signal transduction histidine kinase
MEGDAEKAATMTSTTQDHTVAEQQDDARSPDLLPILEATHALMRELVLDALLPRLMRLAVEHSGAVRGVLLLEQGGELFTRAEAPARPGAPQVLDPIPVSRSEAVPESLVVSVQRTREPLVLGDAGREGAFTQHPYVVRHGTKSVLALPLCGGKGELLGVLYLENHLAAGAFTPARRQALRLLSPVMGAALENALRYRELEQREAKRAAELQRKNAALTQTLHTLESTQEQLIHAEKMASLGQLTAGIAHELKNPLNFITNFAALNASMSQEMLETLASNPQARLSEVEDLLVDMGHNSKKIAEHGRRADGIIRSTVQYASGGSRERRRVELNALLDQYVTLAYHGMRAQRPEANITLERNYDSAVTELEVGPQDLGRVLLNLLNNAFDATLEKQGKVGRGFTPTVSVSTRKLAHGVEIRVGDNGVGISPAVRAKIFDPFFTTKPAGVGTGLGLSLTQDIIQGHRGTLVVESEEGQGATFIITLPG